jgi:hypothetical protein
MVSPCRYAGDLDYYPGIVIICQEPVILMKACQSVMRRCVSILAVLCTLLLTGCGNGRILFSFEPPFWTSIGGGNRLRTALAAAAFMRGYFPRIDVGAAGTDPLAILAGNLASGRYASVIVGPLLSFQWAAFVPEFPGTRFVLVDVPAPDRDLPPNAVFLNFDRTGAFRDAGRAAGESVRGRFGSADISHLGQRIAVLTSVDSDLSAAEVDAFTRGAAEALDGGRPGSRTLAAHPDRTGIRAAVDQMRQAGAEIFLFGLGEDDPLGLEALRDSGGSAVFADWQMSGAFPEQVLMSIEEDVAGGITQAMAALRAGVGRVQGRVSLVSGKKI